MIQRRRSFDKVIKHVSNKRLPIVGSVTRSNEAFKNIPFIAIYLLSIGLFSLQLICVHPAYGQTSEKTNPNAQRQSIMNGTQITGNNNQRSSFLRELRKLENDDNNTLSSQRQNRRQRTSTAQRPSASSTSQSQKTVPTQRPTSGQRNNNRTRNQQNERYQTAYERYQRQRADNDNGGTNTQRSQSRSRYSTTQQASDNQTSDNRSTANQNSRTTSTSSPNQSQSSSRNGANTASGQLNPPIRPINNAMNASTNTANDRIINDDLANQPNNTQNHEEALISDPWASLGLRGGSFIWFPAINISTGYTTNAARSASGESASLIRIAPELRMTSDWSRHSLTGLLRGTYTTYFDSNQEDNKDLEANLNLNLNLSENTTGNLVANYSLTQESNASSIASTGTIATTRADQTRIGGEAGIQHNLSNLALSLRGTIERTFYNNNATSDSTQSNTDDRDQTEYRGSIRLTYQPEARISPFAQTEIGLRRLNNPRATGFNRDSTSYGLSGGIVLNIAPKLSGEAALGYRVENLRDKRLDDISGLTLEASLLWSPTPLTTIQLSTNTNFDTTTIADSSGVIRHQGNIILTHALRRNLLLTVEGSIEHQDTRNSPLETTTYRAGTGMNWHMTRWLQTTANYNYETLQSTTDGEDYTANEFRLGVRLER